MVCSAGTRRAASPRARLETDASNPRESALRAARPYRIASAALLAVAAGGFGLARLAGADPAPAGAAATAALGGVFLVWCVQGKRAGVLPAKGGRLYADEHRRLFAVVWWVYAVIGLAMLGVGAFLSTYATRPG